MKSERLPGLAEPASQEALSVLGNLCVARDQHRTLLGSEGNMGVTLGKVGEERDQVMSPPPPVRGRN